MGSDDGMAAGSGTSLELDPENLLTRSLKVKLFQILLNGFNSSFLRCESVTYLLKEIFIQEFYIFDIAWLN